MDVMWGQLEQAFRDTTVAFSEREALTKNGVIHGFERPGSEISEAAYGDALNQCAYGRRGTNLCMFDTIEGALSDLNIKVVGAHVSDNYPGEIIDPDGTSFDDGWNNRYVRIGDSVHFVQWVSVGVSRTTDELHPSATVLHIAQVDGTYTSPLNPSEFTEVTAILLPFTIRVTQPALLNINAELWQHGEPCLYEVLLYSNSLEPVPPTYLLTEDMNAPTDGATPTGMPFGGQLVDENELGHVVGDSGVDTGPHPIYLIDGTAFPLLTAQLDRLMCSGYFIKIVHEPYDL